MKINVIFNDEQSENLLEKWLEFKKEDLCHMDEDDKRYLINFDDYSQKILNNVTGESYNYVSKKLELMYDDFMNYCAY